jgi:hypothetical protein
MSISTPMADAASVTSFVTLSTFSMIGLIGLTSSPMRAAVGRSSRNRPSCFAPSSAWKECTPVALPPGRARPATRPSLTGSPAALNTIGTVAVAALAATAAGTGAATITAT